VGARTGVVVAMGPGARVMLGRYDCVCGVVVIVCWGSSISSPYWESRVAI
jgi:hypothetical protein